MLDRVAGYFRAMISACGDAVALPPFRIKFDAASADRYRNYAFPDDGAAPDVEAIGRLVAAFEARSRTPRLEYIPELAPRLEAALTACGFTAEGTLPLMSRRATPSRPARDGHQHLLAVSQAELGEAAEVQNQAYGAGPASPADVARLRATLDRGGLVALVRTHDGLAIGSGLVSAPQGGVAEIAAVAVAAEHRRKGVGASVTAFLADQAGLKGVDLPFLMAAHEAEARMYRRIGFDTFATMLHIAR